MWEERNYKSNLALLCASFFGVDKPTDITVILALWGNKIDTINILWAILVFEV